MKRTTAAVILLAAAIVLNVVILFRGDESPGWPIAAILLMAGAGLSLAAQRREP
jgi:MYXO-CTERM domain-containing protein